MKKTVFFLLTAAILVSSQALVLAHGTDGKCSCKTNFTPGNKHTTPAEAAK